MHTVPSGSGSFAHAPALHTSEVHALASPQCSAPSHSTHAPPPGALSSHAGAAALQPLSVAPSAALFTHVMHAGVVAPSHTPPAHAAPSASGALAHTPVPQLSVVQSLLSSQSLAPMHSTHTGAPDVSHSGVAALQPWSVADPA
jgi:hypothetical protein